MAHRVLKLAVSVLLMKTTADPVAPSADKHYLAPLGTS